MNTKIKLVICEDCGTKLPEEQYKIHLFQYCTGKKNSNIYDRIKFSDGCNNKIIEDTEIMEALQKEEYGYDSTINLNYFNFNNNSNNNNNNFNNEIVYNKKNEYFENEKKYQMSEDSELALKLYFTDIHNYEKNNINNNNNNINNLINNKNNENRKKNNNNDFCLFSINEENI